MAPNSGKIVVDKKYCLRASMYYVELSNKNDDFVEHSLLRTSTPTLNVIRSSYSWYRSLDNSCLRKIWFICTT